MTPYPTGLLQDVQLYGADPWRPLVAVLPFTHAGDPTLRLLGQEIADALRERFEADPALQAILISSDFLAMAPPHAVDLVCSQLSIGHIVSGKCHGDKDNPSLYVELADTQGWSVQWARFHRHDARSLLSPHSTGMTQMFEGLRRELLDRPRG